MPQKGKKHKKGRKGPKRSKGRGGHTFTNTQTRIAPDELDIKLMYRDFRTLSNGVSPIVAKAYHTNCAYDVDPAVFSTETYGFDEYAALYSYYRVVGYHYEITCINPMDYDVMFYVLNTNIDPTTVGTRFDLYSTNPYCKSRLVSFRSPNKYTFRGSMSIDKITGTRSTAFADSYRALTTGNPTDLTWLTIGGEAISPATDVIFSYDLKLTLRVKFYSREVDLTLAAFSSRIARHVELRRLYEEEKKKKGLPTFIDEKHEALKAQFYENQRKRSICLPDFPDQFSEDQEAEQNEEEPLSKKQEVTPCNVQLKLKVAPSVQLNTEILSENDIARSSQSEKAEYLDQKLKKRSQNIGKREIPPKA